MALWSPPYVVEGIFCQNLFVTMSSVAVIDLSPGPGVAFVGVPCRHYLQMVDGCKALVMFVRVPQWRERRVQ